MFAKYPVLFSISINYLLLCCGLSGEKNVVLQSPDGRLSWILHTDNKVSHSIKKGDKTILNHSELGIVVDGKDLARGITGWSIQKVKNNIRDTFKTYGKSTSASVLFNEYVISGDKSDLFIRTKVFNNGIAFRYEWSENMKKKTVLYISSENTSFSFPEKSILWTQDSATALNPCEGIWAPSLITDFKKDLNNPRNHIRTIPITIELPDGGLALIQEASNFNKQWSGIKFSLHNGACHTVYFHDPNGFSVPSSVEMPWRVILVNDDLNGLVQNNIIPSLAPAPSNSLFHGNAQSSWIKPGRSTWSWWDSVSVLEKDQYDFVDMAAEFGWEYHLVDEGWKKWGNTLQESMSKVAKLVTYANNKNIGIWVWVKWTDINNPSNNWESMRIFFKDLAKIGIKGIKVDFMDSASQERLLFYDSVAENLAKNKLMVNFHGANTPSGEERSWPHEMSREGIYGGEQNIWTAIEGQHYCALPFTRLVSGHADFTGGYFGHGPKLRGTSWTLQMATNIIYTSPLLHWISNPVDMATAFPKNSPEREVIKNIPSVWDETIVLPQSTIGKCAAFARRYGNKWYIALINGTDQEHIITIPLSFLKKKITYRATFLRDLTEKNDGWAVETRQLSSKDAVSFTMRPKGGGIALLVPDEE